MPQETIQVLGVALSSVTVSRSFFSTTFVDREDIGEGLEWWRGYYQSLRPTQTGAFPEYRYITREVEASDMYALQAVISCDEERAKLEKEADILGAQDDGGGGDALDRVYERLEAIDASTTEKRAAEILFGLEQMQAKKTRDFSGGWRMRIALARTQFMNPTILLLDEPTNHLDLPAKRRLRDVGRNTARQETREWELIRCKRDDLYEGPRGKELTDEGESRSNTSTPYTVGVGLGMLKLSRGGLGGRRVIPTPCTAPGPSSQKTGPRISSFSPVGLQDALDIGL